jgi:Concanavalin A-like lectin/glucanases superfamily
MRRCAPASSLALLLTAAAAGCSTRVLSVVDHPQDPLLRDLVGWWRLDEADGSQTAHDSSGNANDGTLRGLDEAVGAIWEPGISGRSIELRGAGYVEVPLSDSIQSVVDEITVAAWVYFEGSITVDFGTAISREIGGSLDQHYHLALQLESPFPTESVGANLFVTTTGGGAKPNDSTSVRRSVWYHLAGTYDGNSANLYVNGTLVAMLTLTGPLAADSTPLIIGGNANGLVMGVTERFPGRLDEVMLYRRALSADEINRLYRLDLPQVAP